MAERWRLILDASDVIGSVNMARDEAILSAVGTKQVPPTVRLYGWNPACLSLGYGQSGRDLDRDRLAEHGWSAVRRLSGGRAILHVDELTYSVALSADHPLAAGGVLESYRRLSVALLSMVHGLGVQADSVPMTAHEKGKMRPVCFETSSDYEITSGGRKLIGSAQVRALGGVLQHGAIPLIGDVGRICDGLHFADDSARQAAYSSVRGHAITVSEAAERNIKWSEAADALITAFSKSFDLEFMPGELTGSELANAETLNTNRYGADSWTFRR